MTRARNWLAVHAHFRGGAGPHQDRREYVLARVVEAEIEEALADEGRDVDDSGEWSDAPVSAW